MSSRSACFLVACVAATALTVAPCDAQTRMRPVGLGVSIDERATGGREATPLLPPAANPASWWAPAASLAIPGAGQSLLKQPRSVAYLATEAFLIIQYLAAKRDGNRDRAEYRTLAADIARKKFGGTQVGPWEYYESMEKYDASGAFDMIAGGQINPETDTLTYNGARWLLARLNFWANPNVTPSTSSPEYQRALAFYVNSAAGEEYLWSWRDQQLQRDLYKQTIRSANRGYQRATSMVGIIAANHLASLIDAYISVRLRRFGGSTDGGRTSGLRFDGISTGYSTTPTGDRQLLIGLRAK